jgi:hypothetical protein
MELIFTLILLIGLGINSHNLENRHKEINKDAAVSSLLKETESTDFIQTKKFETGTNEKEQIFVNDTKGKYISIRVVSGNTYGSIYKVKRKTIEL